MTASDAEIIQQLTQAIARAVPITFGEGCELASMPPQRLDRRYSFMFRCWFTRPGGEMKSLLVKIPRDSWMKSMHQAIESEHIRDVIQNEYESMALIATAISEAKMPGLCAIGSLAVLPGFNGLLMEEIPIRMLKTSLTKPAIMLGLRKDWQEFETQCQLAGTWLKVIHDRFMSGETATLESLQANERLESELETLEEFSGKPLNELRALFQRLYSALNGVEIPLTCLHNDFQLGNVFVTSSGSVGVLDPNWLNNGPVFADLATLLIDPVTRKAQVLTLGLSFRPALRKLYERAVLQGYYGGSNEPTPMLDFYCALAVLAKWRANEELLNTGSSKWSRAGSARIAPLMRGYFQRLAREYLLRGLKAT